LTSGGRSMRSGANCAQLIELTRFFEGMPELCATTGQVRRLRDDRVRVAAPPPQEMAYWNARRT